MNIETLHTPFGAMIAIADEYQLYFLDFADCQGLEQEIKYIEKHTKSTIIPGRTTPIDSIEIELKKYFNGTLQKFKTPLNFLGTSFQQQVWQQLQQIPFGQTRSYAAIASAIGKPSAFRAVAQANSANRFVIVVPCHRVININGKLGGYSGNLERKQWLLNHERNSS